MIVTLKPCTSCTPSSVSEEDCECDGADFVSGWLNSFEFDDAPPSPDELPDEMENVDRTSYGRLTVNMSGRQYQFAFKRSFWDKFVTRISGSKRDGLSAGSYWNNVKDGKYDTPSDVVFELSGNDS